VTATAKTKKINHFMSKYTPIHMVAKKETSITKYDDVNAGYRISEFPN